jgi:XTP/dITP diphosphohydrolase
MQTRLQNVLLIATNNPGKLKEFRQLLGNLPGIELASPKELRISPQFEESGATYAENAAIKARVYVEASGLVVLADDSGLEVDALEGAPGLFSARYSGQTNATDADRRVFLLENLAEKPRPWLARFRAVIAVAAPGQEMRFAEGVCEGEIIPEERGTNGFGYDPIFYMPEFNRTMAELSDEEKNKVSHRGRGVEEAVPILREVFGSLDE